ncbi:3'-5' exonuclease [Deferribacter thermophilus]|uniref:3'-5' exonuclease n=1 Tax=Deferribacter thermophilus TaxID=53573 RepID=UPI003C24743E
MILEYAELLDKKIDEIEYCVFDIESTGVNPFDGDRIVEIGAVKIKKGFAIDRKNKFHILVNPGIPIPDKAKNIHGITDDDVVNAPDECEAYYKFIEYSKGCVPVAHNAKKDMAFLRRISKEYMIREPFDFILDTLTISRKVNLLDKYHNLDALIEKYNVKIKSNFKRHRALYDAEATSVVFKIMMNWINENYKFSLIELFQFLDMRI